MARPPIGITTSLTETAQTLQRRYVDAVERAGGTPVIVAQATDSETQRPLLDVLDGLVITGGPGITEGLVGQLPEDLPAVDLHRWKSDCVAFDVLRENGDRCWAFATGCSLSTRAWAARSLPMCRLNLAWGLTRLSAQEAST